MDENVRHALFKAGISQVRQGLSSDGKYLPYGERSNILVELVQLIVPCLFRLGAQVLGVRASCFQKSISLLFSCIRGFDEKREALDLWAARLRSIVEPPPANVIQIKREAH